MIIYYYIHVENTQLVCQRVTYVKFPEIIEKNPFPTISSSALPSLYGLAAGE
jgi:hypothetical protein